MYCKSYSHFFSKKFQRICISLDVNFNESLTNDIVSFEQLGPDFLTHVRFNPCPPDLQDSGRSIQNWISYGDDKVKQRLFQQSRRCNSQNKWSYLTSFRTCLRFYPCLPYLQFQEVPIKTEQDIVMTKSKRGFFQQSNVILKLNLAKFRTCSRIYPCPPYMQVSGRSDQNWMNYADDKVKQGPFQQSWGCKINDPIWPVLELVGDFIYVHLYLQVSGASDQNWMRTDEEVKQRLFLQSRGHNSKINDLIWPAFLTSKTSSMSTLSANFRNIWSKLNELWWQQTFSHCKSIETCGCQSNQGFHWISMKSLCHQSPTRGMLQMRNDWDQPADCGDITGQRHWWTMAGPLSYKTPWNLWPRWAKK